jgi:radial spoke head protein 9
MQWNNLENELCYANATGSTLSVHEQTHLNIAVINLYNTEKFDNIVFWGRIRGISNDYYVLCGLRFKGKADFPEKHFYWCYNDWNLSPLLPVHSDHFQFLKKTNGYFSGQHDKILKSGNTEGTTEEVSVVNGTVYR